MDWMYDQLFDGRRLWVLTLVDKLSYGLMKSAGWRDGAVFEGTMTFMGVEQSLRQTWRREGDELHLTNEEMLEDIKQLITANNHILSLELEQKLDEKLRAQTEELRSIMDVSFDAVQEQLDDHETRIGTLENATV